MSFILLLASGLAGDILEVLSRKNLGPITSIILGVALIVAIIVRTPKKKSKQDAIYNSDAFVEQQIKLLSQDKVKEVINNLLRREDYYDDSVLETVVMISARYKEALKNTMRGTANDDTRMAKIRNSLLILLNSMKSTD